MTDKTKKICVRMPNWIGDAVMALPSLKAIREHFQTAKLVVATNSHCADIYRYVDFPIEQLIVLEKRNILSNARKLRSFGFDIIIYFTNSFSSALEGFLAHIEQRIGYSTDSRGFLLTGKITPDRKTVRHHRIYYFNLVCKSFGVRNNIGIPILKRNNISPRVLTNNGWTPKRLTIGINPGAAYGSAKRWLPERFSETAEHFLKNNYQTVIFAGKGLESDTANIIAGKLPAAINMAGKTSLSELIESIASCDLFLTNDSGPMHIASALSVPIVALFGPTDPSSTSPSGGLYRIVTTNEPCSPCLKRECPLKHHNCMKKITSRMVIKALEDLTRIVKNGKTN
jgi:heptosyltransferase-2